jgi:hypothetical protein
MTDDLVKRLRDGGPCWDMGHKCRAMEAKSGCICAESADALERLSQQQAEPTRSQKLAEAGFTRRPSWKSLPSDADQQQAEPANDPLTLARLFHATYERLAPEYGYETRPDTKDFDPESKNGRLMVRVCAEISNAVFCPTPAAQQAEPPKKINFKEAFEKARQNPAYWEERAELESAAHPADDDGKLQRELQHYKNCLGIAADQVNEAVKLLREAKDYLDRWEARPSLQLAIDAYLARVKV